VSPDEVRAYFEKNRTMFQTPEKRALTLLVVDEARVSQKTVAPDAELRRAYEAAKDQYRTPERVEVRHILLKTTEKSSEEIPKIEARARELLKQIKSGSDFAEVARKNSEDPGSAEKGGDLGWVARGQTVAAFESSAFSLKPGQLSDVIKTEYGFHILQVMKKEEARLKPFEEVRQQLEQERKKQMVYETMQRVADQARDELAKSPQQASDIARRFDIQLVTVDKAGPGDPLPEVGVSRALEDAILGLQKGQVTPVVQVQENKLAVAALTDVFPARPAEFSEVEGQIRERLLGEKAAQFADQKAREAAEKARSLKGDLKKLAQTMGLEVKTTQEFGPDGAADGIGQASFVAEAFSQPAGAVFGPVTVGDQRFVCKVVSKTDADMSKLAEQRSMVLTDLKGRKARERNELFEDSLRAELIREGKVKIHRDVINRLVSNYRS
jgi:peptidyl-prolyl cis-trans isomerase D